MAANNGLLLWIMIIAVVIWFIWSYSNQKSDFVFLSPSFLDNQQDKYICNCTAYPVPWLKKIICDDFDITGNNTYYCTSDSPGCRAEICNSPTGCL